LICSGQVYYDLVAKREQLKRNDVAIITLEQIAPFPYTDLHGNLMKYPNAEIFWVQEEHMNQGCWGYVEPRLRSMIKKYGLKNKQEITYIGRRSCSASSAGWADLHEKELNEFLTAAFN